MDDLKVVERVPLTRIEKKDDETRPEIHEICAGSRPKPP